LSGDNDKKLQYSNNRDNDNNININNNSPEKNLTDNQAIIIKNNIGDEMFIENIWN